MNTYPREIVEKMIINLYRHDDVESCFDAIFDNPELRHELESDDITADEMVERIYKKHGLNFEADLR